MGARRGKWSDEKNAEGSAAMETRLLGTKRLRAAYAAAGLAAVLSLPAHGEWGTREGAGGVEAGTVIEGRLAGLLLRCGGAGGAALVLTHNGAVFDRDRDHTIVVSIDGTATLLSARAMASGRFGDDDFVHHAAPGALEPLLSSLARGREVEISSPSGRYALALSGSSRAIAAFRQGCPGA